jgi:hypothetical protein
MRWKVRQLLRQRSGAFEVSIVIAAFGLFMLAGIIYSLVAI